MKLALTILALLPFALAHASAGDLTLRTPRGSSLNVKISAPNAPVQNAPALVIAPGGGYHMDLPLLKDLAEKAASQGFIVYRFNWSYFTAEPKGQPSADLSAEAEDMNTVLAHARSHPQVDVNRILIGGKSLGSIVSFGVFSKDAALKGLLLLTPVCTNYETGLPSGEENYPGLASEARSMAVVMGNKDQLCQLPMLYDLLENTKGNVSLNVFGGGHSMIFGKPGDPANAAKDAANLSAAVQAAALWAEFLAGN